jgi:hypothetical protein
VAQRVPLPVVLASVTLTSVQRKEVSRHDVVYIELSSAFASQIAKESISIIFNTLRLILTRVSTRKNKNYFVKQIAVSLNGNLFLLAYIFFCRCW